PILYGRQRWPAAYRLRRPPSEIEHCSADIASLLHASGNLLLWGWVKVFDRTEASLFPGAAVPFLIAAAVVVGWRSGRADSMRRVRAARWIGIVGVLFLLVSVVPFV